MEVVVCQKKDQSWCEATSFLLVQKNNVCIHAGSRRSYVRHRPLVVAPMTSWIGMMLCGDAA